MKIRRFNEDITDVINPDYSNGLSQNPNVSIFTDIEGDLENMPPEEAEDYLLSIITFCNQQLQGYRSLED